jgi:hypothetical protein
MSNEYSEENTGKPKVFLLYQVANGCIQLATLLAGHMQTNTLYSIARTVWVGGPALAKYRKLRHYQRIICPHQFNIFRM